MVTGSRSAETPLLHRWEGSVEWALGDVFEDVLFVVRQRVSGLAVGQFFADFVCCFPLSWNVVLAVRRLQYIASCSEVVISDEVR